MRQYGLNSIGEASPSIIWRWQSFCVFKCYTEVLVFRQNISNVSLQFVQKISIAGYTLLNCRKGVQTASIDDFIDFLSLCFPTFPAGPANRNSSMYAHILPFGLRLHLSSHWHLHVYAPRPHGLPWKHNFLLSQWPPSYDPLPRPLSCRSPNQGMSSNTGSLQHQGVNLCASCSPVRTFKPTLAPRPWGNCHRLQNYW